MISLVWSAAAGAVAVKCPRLQPFRASEVNANAVSHRESIVRSQTMTDLQNEMHQTNPAFITRAKMNDLRNPFIKRPHLTLAKPRRIYSRPVCRLKLDRGESVHLRCPVAIDRTVWESPSRWRRVNRGEKRIKKHPRVSGLWGQEVLFMCLWMAVSPVTSWCRSRWETAITRDHFLFPISHLSSVVCGVKMPLNLACVRRKKAVHRLSCGPHNRGGGDDVRKQRMGAKNALFPITTDLLKPEEPKSYFLLSSKITQWLLPLRSWHSNYACLRNARPQEVHELPTI